MPLHIGSPAGGVLCFIYYLMYVGDILQPLEDVIHCSFLSVLLGISPPINTLCNLVVLPPYLGGLRILNSTALSAQNTLPLLPSLSYCHIILDQSSVFYFWVRSEQFSRKFEIHLSKHLCGCCLCGPCFILGTSFPSSH